jgi:outer membrane phospholipase A
MTIFRLLPFALFASFSVASPALAVPQQMLAPAVDAVAPTQDIAVDLVLLNAGGSAESFVAPSRIAARIVDERGNATGATLVREAASDEPIAIAPGAFAKVRYTVLTRERPKLGKVRIEIDGAASSATLALIDTPAATTTTADAPKAPSSLGQRAKEIGSHLGNSLRADPEFQTEQGLVEFLAYRIKPHEPMYFLVGPDQPNAKFQLSLKYQVFDPKGSVARTIPGLGDLYLGYTQLSFWDLEGDSKPFFDNNYKPEVFFAFNELDEYLRDPGTKKRWLPDGIRFDLQTGLLHESNGQSGDDSRSINVAYVRPALTLGDRRDWFFSIGPRFVAYLDKSENDDIDDYRGHMEIRAVVGQGGGLQLAATGRLGNDSFDLGSLQLDLSFPIRQLSGKNLDVYFHTQYFTGFGESLLLYNQHDSTYRFGISLVR